MLANIASTELGLLNSQAGAGSSSTTIEQNNNRITQHQDDDGVVSFRYRVKFSKGLWGFYFGSSRIYSINHFD